MRRFIFVCGLLIISDQLSKLWASYQQLVVLNPGISFSQFSNFSTEMVVGVTLIMLVTVIGVWTRWYPREFWGKAFFLAGGISNSIDRIVVGAVRDWLPVPFVGIHNNFADWWIFIGVLLFIYSLRHQE